MADTGGWVFIGNKRIIVGADGNSSFTFSTEADLARKTIMATATNAQGNTSEFSASRDVAAASRRP
jgi:hypothetical protein